MMRERAMCADNPKWSYWTTGRVELPVAGRERDRYADEPVTASRKSWAEWASFAYMPPRLSAVTVWQLFFEWTLSFSAITPTALARITQ